MSVLGVGGERETGQDVRSGNGNIKNLIQKFSHRCFSYKQHC